MMCRHVFILAGLLVTATVTGAAEAPIATRIDNHIQAKWKAEGITQAEQVSDEGFIRRVTLDLVGRIPTASEVHAYVTSNESDKRTQLVDRLLATPAYARYQAYLFDFMLNDPTGQGNKGKSSLRDYLTAAIAENRPWDVIYRQLLLPNETDPKQKGTSEYLRPKLGDLDRLTNDVSVTFFGVNVSCAQCHDHPEVTDWKQDHFYGMKSFLARTYDAGGIVTERSAGLIKFKPNAGPERQAKLMFLTGVVAETDTLRELSKDEQKAEKDAMEKAKSGKTAPSTPKFSARQKLVDLSLQPEARGYFSKAIVNRLWHRFLGNGLVNPLDQMHSANPASHPELLTTLASDLEAHHYDLRRLVRGIVLSNTYSLGSRYGSEAHPAANRFAVASIKPLTPWQLALSLKIATTDPKAFEGLPASDLGKKLDTLEAASRGLMGQFTMPGDKAQISVSEALFFSNGDRLGKELLVEGKDSLLTRVTAEKDTQAAIKTLVQAMLNRSATAEELTVMGKFLDSRQERKTEAYRHVMWAIGTSPEFRFNH